MPAHYGVVWSCSEDKNITAHKLDGFTKVRFYTLDSPVGQIAVHPKRPLLFAGCDNGLLYVLETTTAERRIVTILEGHTGFICDVRLSSDWRYVATSSDDRTVIVRSAHQYHEAQPESFALKPMYVLKEHGARVQCLAFSPNNKYLASGSDDKTVIVWKLADGLRHVQLSGHENWVLCVLFSLSSENIITGSCDKTVRVWSVSSGKPEQKITRSKDWVWDLAFNSTGTLMVAVGQEPSAYVYLGHNFQFARSVSVSSGMRSVVFSPNGHFLIYSRDNGSITAQKLVGSGSTTIYHHTRCATGLALGPSMLIFNTSHACLTLVVELDEVPVVFYPDAGSLSLQSRKPPAAPRTPPRTFDTAMARHLFTLFR